MAETTGAGRGLVEAALAAAYRVVHRTLDGEPPGDYELSRAHDLLAVALTEVGSSGAEALGRA